MMDTDLAVKVAATLAIVLITKRRKKQLSLKKKRVWVRNWIKNREKFRVVENLLQELRLGDEQFYSNFLKMSVVDFNYLLEKISPLIKKKDTLMRKAITPAERLIVTLRYLATGYSYKSLMHLFRIPASTISGIVPEVCQAIYDVLNDEYLKIPNTEKDWIKISDEFEETWNFPNCLGAIGGKHITIKAPANSGSMYFNYRRKHSIILMGVADANYKFTYINVGTPGRDVDGGVFSNCLLSQTLENNTISIPQPKPLPGRRIPIPYVLIGDDAFALKSYMMKPFAKRNLSVPERIFNYRLFRARRIIENVFGIVSVRFRVLINTMEVSPPNVQKIVSAVCVLHNYLMSRTHSAGIYIPRGTFDAYNEDGTISNGTWRTDLAINLAELRKNESRNATLRARNVREEFKEYFSREGEVAWQHTYI